MQRTVWSFIRVAEIAVMMDVDVYFRTCQITKFYDFPTKSDIGILFCIHNIFRDNFQPKFCLVLPTESGKCINVFVQLADNLQALPFYIIYRLILATAIHALQSVGFGRSILLAKCVSPHRVTENGWIPSNCVNSSAQSWSDTIRK